VAFGISADLLGGLEDILEEPFAGARCAVVVVGYCVEELNLRLLEEADDSSGHAESFALLLLCRRRRRNAPDRIRSSGAGALAPRARVGGRLPWARRRRFPRSPRRRARARQGRA